MASATLTPDPQRFPPGTIMGAYRASAWSGRDHTVAPTGAADATAAVTAAGQLTFTGLADQTSYRAHAIGVGGFSFSTRHDRVDDGAATLVTPISLGNLGATPVVDLRGRSNVLIRGTLNTNAAFTHTNVVAGAQWYEEIKQDATGGWKAAWTGITWLTNSPPVLWPGANAVTVIEFFSPDGATIYGVTVSSPSDRAQGLPYSHPDVMETMPLLIADNARGMGSGSMVISHFTPDFDLPITTLASLCNGTLAATPTLSKMGLYEYQGGGNYVCRGRSAHDAALWTGAQGIFEKPIADDGTGVSGSTPAAGYTLRAGIEYGHAVLFVGTTAPQLAGRAPTSGAGGVGSPLTYRGKRMSVVVNGQVDIPATLAAQNTLTSAVLWGGAR